MTFQTMFVVRLLDANREILAWNKLPAYTKGDGGLWAVHDFVAEAERDGVATAVNFHWVDVNVHQTRPLPQPFSVAAGQVFSVRITDGPMLHIQSEDLPLPQVTVRDPIVIGVGTAR